MARGQAVNGGPEQPINVDGGGKEVGFPRKGKTRYKLRLGHISHKLSYPPNGRTRQPSQSIMSPPNIVLFTYDLSVYGRKVEWYLNLRGIKYAKCLTRERLPREQLETLGIRYRRIPFLAIGRDVYCDSREIIQKLEELIPENRLGSSDPFTAGIEYLMETWVNDGGPFGRTAGLIPPIPEVLKDDFIEDRSEMAGRPFTREALAMMRPEALAHARWFLDKVENRLLADGRQYMSGQDKPGMADVHTAWVYDWMFGMQQNMGPYLKGTIDETMYPKTFAWQARNRQYHEELLKKIGKPEVLSNEQAYERVLSSDYFEKDLKVDSTDPLELSEGQLIEVWPIDSGQNHHDKGKIVAIGVHEVVIESEVPGGKGHLHLHFPRINFRIAPIQESRL